MSIFVQFLVFVVICIILAVALIKKLTHEDSETHEDSKKCFLKSIQGFFDSMPKLMKEILLWTSITIMVILFLNIVVTFGEKHGVWIESVMSHEETLLMLISLIATITIAFFQYQIQRTLEKEEDVRRDIATNQHKIELRSERLRSLENISLMTGHGINTHLINNLIAPSYNVSLDYVCYIQLNGDTKKSCVFFPEYFELQNFEVYILDNDDISTLFIIPKENVILNQTMLKISISKYRLQHDRDFENLINRFFASVVQRNRPCVICIRLKIGCYDKSTFVDDGYLKMDYSLNFKVSIQRGYDRYGVFGISISDLQICLENCN